MSGNDRPEVSAYKELEGLVRALGEELAAFRRRALAAEAQVKDGGATPRDRTSTSEPRTALEEENAALKSRLGRAEEQMGQMLERVRFLRQQLQTQPTVGAGRP
jgi:predicted  nucleic acid-binding Zn-ribbon protein